MCLQHVPFILWPLLFLKAHQQLVSWGIFLSALVPFSWLEAFPKGITGICLNVLLGHTQWLRPSWGVVLSRLSDCHAFLIFLTCSSNPLFSSSHSFSIPKGLVFMIILAFLGPHLYNGCLSSDVLGFWWDNLFLDVAPFKKVLISQEINERGALIFCYAKHRGNCFKIPPYDEKHCWKLDQPCFKRGSRFLHLIF